MNRGFDKTDNAATAKEIRKAVEHITGEQGYFKPIYSIAQEICANSVEHANENTYKKNWLFSTSYLDGEVVFTMTDIGDGILKTLKRKFVKQIQDELLKILLMFWLMLLKNNMNLGLKTLIETKAFQRFIKYHQKNTLKI